MHLTDTDQRRLAQACTLSLDWHAKQSRKGSDIPYWSHLSQVAGGILEHGGDVDQAIAGLFHDALEDASNPEERATQEKIIGEEFGPPVLDIVLACTDTQSDESLDDKAPWKARKTHFLEQLSEASPRSLLVIACDKRHNLHSLVWDLRFQGLSYLERFNAGPADQIWYFESLLDKLRDRVPGRLFAELESLHEEFRALVASKL